MASHLLTDSALLEQRPDPAERAARITELRRQMSLDLEMFGVVWSSHYYVTPAPDLSARIDRLGPGELEQLAGVEARVADYVHWDDIRFLEPRGGTTIEDLWLQIRVPRAPMRRSLPLMGLDGRPLSYTEPAQVVGLLAAIDAHEAGHPGWDDALLEEALYSSGLALSALAGNPVLDVAIAPDLAARLIGAGQAPEGRDELFLIRNVRALELVRARAGAALTPETVIEIQQILGGDAGEEQPAALVERLRRMCDFANVRGVGAGPEMHPILRAILLHFWVLYEHPFASANGRTGRALFYWAALRAGYGIFERLSISRELHVSPSQYCRSFVEVDTDAGDATYFLLDQLHVIERAIGRQEAGSR